MDVGPVRLFGAFETPRGRRCRVLWRDGTLYVMSDRRTVVALDVPVRPSPDGATPSTWSGVLADGGEFTVTKEGCPRCGFTLMKIPARKIPDLVPA